MHFYSFYDTKKLKTTLTSFHPLSLITRESCLMHDPHNNSPSSYPLKQTMETWYFHAISFPSISFPIISIKPNKGFIKT